MAVAIKGSQKLAAIPIHSEIMRFNEVVNIANFPLAMLKPWTATGLRELSL